MIWRSVYVQGTDRGDSSGVGTVVNFLVRWIISALALMLIAYLIPGIHAGFASALAAAVVIGLLNAFLRPLFLLVTLPLTIVTFGLFILVVNALLFGLAAWLVPGFTVHGFRAALAGSILYAIVNLVTRFNWRLARYSRGVARGSQFWF